MNSTARSVRVCRKSTTSNSSTSVSASSTNTSARRCSRVMLSSCASLLKRPDAIVRRSSRVVPEIRRAGHDVAGDVSDRALLGVGPGTEHDQRLGQTYSRLYRNDPGRLVYLCPVVEQGDGGRRELIVGGPRLQVQQQQGGRVGERQRLPQVTGGQGARGFAVQVEHSHADGADPEWEGEHRGDSGAQGTGGERRPEPRRGGGEVGLEDRATRLRGVDARPLAEGELEVLEGQRGAVGGRDRPSRSTLGHE